MLTSAVKNLKIYTSWDEKNTAQMQDMRDNSSEKDSAILLCTSERGTLISRDLWPDTKDSFNLQQAKMISCT